MPTDIKRRQAFANSFKDYPHYLEKFASEHCSIVHPETGERKEIANSDKNSIMQVCFAQFLTRLIRTRCRNSTADMAGFGMDTAGRYNDFKTRLLGEYEITADDKYQRAINAIEQEIANIVLMALMTEAKISGATGEKSDFVEADFWWDVFSAFKLIQASHHPIWTNALNKIFFNHHREFARQLAGEADAAPEAAAEPQDGQEGGQ